MAKIETLTFEYEHCGECSNAGLKRGGNYCVKTKRTIPDVWGKIPDWCPLEDKKESDNE